MRYSIIQISVDPIFYAPVWVFLVRRDSVLLSSDKPKARNF